MPPPLIYTNLQIWFCSFHTLKHYFVPNFKVNFLQDPYAENFEEDELEGKKKPKRKPKEPKAPKEPKPAKEPKEKGAKRYLSSIFPFSYSVFPPVHHLLRQRFFVKGKERKRAKRTEKAWQEAHRALRRWGKSCWEGVQAEKVERLT